MASRFLPGPEEFYDAVAPVYDQRYAYSHAMTARQCAWLVRVCGVGRVLELGCGTGRMLGVLARAGYRPVGMDCSPRMLAVARAKAPSVPLVRALAPPLPFLDQSFDLVVALHATVVHITSWEDLEALAQEVWRVLVPGGTFVVELPHPRSFPPPGRSWRTFRQGMHCRWVGEGLVEMRLGDYQGLSTLIRVLDIQDLKRWLEPFEKLQLHPGFSGGRFNPAKGTTMVVCARRSR